MHLKENTSRALKAWIGLDTWYTNHDLDMRRFYKFVDQYAHEHGVYLDEGALTEEISERLRQSGHFTESLQQVAVKRVSLARYILEFLEASERVAPVDVEDEDFDL